MSSTELAMSSTELAYGATLFSGTELAYGQVVHGARYPISVPHTRVVHGAGEAASLQVDICARTRGGRLPPNALSPYA
eukprot:239028-Rhodomonas_salina.2